MKKTCAVSEPLSRHHCRKCSHVTLSPFGKTVVSCDGCGAEVGDTSYALDMCRRLVAGHLGTFTEGDFVKDYSKLDAEVTHFLATLPLGRRVW